jgi:D-sedoheptulose 7-phosphate isomerase
MKEDIQSIINDHVQIIANMQQRAQEVINIGNTLIRALKEKNKILICGNGGSAADAQHFAGELTGRFETNRQPLAAIAITTDTTALTAIGNDFSFDSVFARQVEAIGQKGDILIGISTSGNSKNVIKAVEVSKSIGMTSIGFLGKNGGDLLNMTDMHFLVEGTSTARIQEGHILLIHLLCYMIDKSFHS